MSAQGKLQTTVAQESADHKNLTKNLSKEIFGQGVEQQRFKRTLDDQHELVSSIRNDVHAINGRQRSLAQSMTAESRNTRDQISLQGRNQETAFRDSGRMIVQLQADVQHTDTQVEVLLALAESMAGSVVFPNL